MAKDPVCGMDIKEKGNQHRLHFEHETVYFCSKQCKEKYQYPGKKYALKKKGPFVRFLEKLAKDNEQTYGGTPPKCH